MKFGRKEKTKLKVKTEKENKYIVKQACLTKKGG